MMPKRDFWHHYLILHFVQNDRRGQALRLFFYGLHIMLPFVGTVPCVILNGAEGAVEESDAYTDTPKSRNASLRVVFLSVDSLRRPIINAHDTLYSPAGNCLR